MIHVNFFLLLNLTISFLKSSYQVELCGIEERGQWEFPLRVHSFRMRGSGFALGEPLFEWGLGWAAIHAGSSSDGPWRGSLAPFTSVSRCLGWHTLIPGTGWIPRAVSVLTHTVRSPLVCGVTALLALWPVALSSSGPWQHLRIKEYGVQRTLALWHPISSSSVYRSILTASLWYSMHGTQFSLKIHRILSANLT